MTPRLELVPWDAVLAVAALMTTNVGKHDQGSRPTWRERLSTEDIADKLDRHLDAWRHGHDVDAEGHSHLAAVAANALMLLSANLAPTVTDDPR